MSALGTHTKCSGGEGVNDGLFAGRVLNYHYRSRGDTNTAVISSTADPITLLALRLIQAVIGPGNELRDISPMTWLVACDADAYVQ